MELPKLPNAVAGQSLAEAVYVALRDAIMRGDLEPGTRLREVHLSQHFEVSTTPVRAALQRLDFEGLATAHARRGATVARLDGTDLRQLYELREVLECHAVRQAAAMRPDVSELDEVLAAAAAVVDEVNQTRFNELDVQFHGVLAGLGGNEHLVRAAQQAHRRIQAVRVQCSVHLPDRPRTSHAQHIAIRDAVVAGDADTTERLLREHIRSVHAAVADVLERDEELAESTEVEATG